MRLRPAPIVAGLLAFGLAGLAPQPVRAEPAKPAVARSGVVTTPSVFGMQETIARLKADIAAKGIMFFAEIDQSGLAAGAGIALKPSTLLIFGNPPLGTQFITAKPEAGLDWPVRLLVYQDDKGAVRTAYTDFGWIARRHEIKTRDAQFAMASGVIASIVSSVAPPARSAKSSAAVR